MVAINQYEILLQSSPSPELLSKLQVLDPHLVFIPALEPTLLTANLSLITPHLSNHRVIGTPSALVCMFEFFNGIQGWPEKTSKGICRITPTPKQSQFQVDLSVTLPSTGATFKAGIYEYGDFSNLSAVGKQLLDLGTLQGGKLNTIVKGEMYDWVGRSICITNNKNDDLVGGIIARAAGIFRFTLGVFENQKRVCSCTGKVIWEESKL